MEKLYFRRYGRDFGRMIGCPDVGTGNVLFKTHTHGGGWVFDMAIADYGDRLPEGVELVTPESVEKKIQTFFWDSAIIDGVLYIAEESSIGRVIGQKGWKINLLRRLGVKEVKQGYLVPEDAKVISGKVRATVNRKIAVPGTIMIMEAPFLQNCNSGVWIPDLGQWWGKIRKSETIFLVNAQGDKKIPLIFNRTQYKCRKTLMGDERLEVWGLLDIPKEISPDEHWVITEVWENMTEEKTKYLPGAHREEWLNEHGLANPTIKGSKPPSDSIF